MNRRAVNKLWTYAPCAEGLVWFVDQPNQQAAWDTCPNGNWMFWVLCRAALAQLAQKKLGALVEQLSQHRIFSISSAARADFGEAQWYRALPLNRLAGFNKGYTKLARQRLADAVREVFPRVPRLR